MLKEIIIYKKGFSENTSLTLMLRFIIIIIMLCLLIFFYHSRFFQNTVFLFSF